MSEYRWQDEAACRGVDPDIFFPSKGNTAEVRRAKSFCRSCPVVDECLDAWLDYSFAKDWRDDAGIVGNTTPNERRAVRTARLQLARSA